MGNVFNRYGAGGGKSEGLYLWKKSKATPMLYISHFLPASNNLIDAYLPASIVYHVLEGDTVTAHTDGTVTVDNPTIITIDGDTSDTTCYLKYGKYYSIAESTTGEVFVSTLQSDTRVFLSWSGNNHKLFVQGGISTTYPINYYASKNELEFIDYVVSDKEDAYPDGAEQGGYYYERYEPKAIGGGITFWGQSPTTLTIEHHAGKNPILFALARTSYTGNSVNGYAVDVLYANIPNYMTSDFALDPCAVRYANATITATANDITITLSSTSYANKFYQGEYKWYAVV